MAQLPTNVWLSDGSDILLLAIAVACGGRDRKRYSVQHGPDDRRASPKRRTENAILETIY